MRIVTLVAALAAAAPAGAATLIPVPAVPGSTITSIGGINDQNIIVGDYQNSDGVTHGFFGTLDGQYTTFDFDNVNLPGTTGRDIDNAGNVVGIANLKQANTFNLIEYERFADGSMKAITNHRAQIHGVPGGLSPHGTFAAENWHEDATVDGFLGRNAKVKMQLDLGFAVQRLRPRETTDSGIVVGYFKPTAGGAYQGFVMHDGTTDVINFPDENAVNGTLLEGINSKGVITGIWQDADFNQHAFYYDRRSAAFKSIHVPDFPFSTADGINKADLIAVQAYSQDLFTTVSYVYCPKKPSKCPGSGFEIADPKPVFMPAAGVRLRQVAPKAVDPRRASLVRLR